MTIHIDSDPSDFDGLPSLPALRLDQGSGRRWDEPSTWACGCDGAGPHCAGYLKRYDLGANGSAILCHLCWEQLNTMEPKQDWHKTEPYLT